jgi:hypothetical protein
MYTFQIGEQEQNERGLGGRNLLQQEQREGARRATGQQAGPA